MADIKQAVQAQFGQVAANYRTSQVHAAGADLERLAALVAERSAGLALDAGCGAGHTAAAIAPYVQQVIAYDLTETMLAQVQQLAAARDLTNITTQQGDIEALSYDDATFGVVVSRYSAHHWPHPQVAMQEIARVLKPGGCFILSDIVAPPEAAQDTFLQTLELLRDPSHVRDHSITQWQTFFAEAGLDAGTVEMTWQLPLEFESWVTRIQTPPLHVEMLRALFDGAPAEIRTAFALEPGQYDFQIPGALLLTIKH